MHIHSLDLHHFRSYESQRLQFCPGINILYGPNATGKTTVLEAIYLFLSGRSFRPSQSTDWIQKQASHFALEITFDKHEMEHHLRMYQDAHQKHLFYNHSPLQTTASLLGILQGVVMTPDDVKLIKGAPQERRSFLDFQLAQVDPLYVHYLTRYSRAMRQRNQLLKQKRTDTITSWEQEMAKASAYIISKRELLAQSLQNSAQKWYQLLSSSSEAFAIHYKASAKDLSGPAQIQDELLKKLYSLRSKELLLGYSLTGPHKEELEFFLDEKEVKFFASEGQQRTYLTALRLAEWEELLMRSECKPIMMIDDVGLGLDSARQKKLFSALQQMGQVFLTTTEAPHFPFSKEVCLIDTRDFV